MLVLTKSIRTGLFALILLSFSMMAHATTEIVSADVEFVAPITITEVNALQFGFVSTGALASETLIMATNGGLTGTGMARSLGGTKGAAEVTVTAEALHTVNILIDPVAPGAFYTLGAFTCDYDGEGSTACSSSFQPAVTATSATLLIGATLTASGGASAGAANGTFVVNVTYP